MPLKQSEAPQLSIWCPVVFGFLHKGHIKVNTIRRLTSPALLQSGERQKKMLKTPKRHRELSITV